MEKEENIRFTVITKARKSAVDFVKKLAGFTIEIIFLYFIFFKYIAMHIIRSNFFGKNTQIWYQDMPQPQIMFVLFDAINMARIERDLLK